jgi:phthiocerol/phenolphthiocerol synthesis type-I polyketide synthase D
LYCRGIVRHLDQERPVYGVQPDIARIQDSRNPADIESMASAYADCLCNFFPSGSLNLAGYSFAGFLAYETARQLQTRGRQVNVLAIIDTGPSPATEGVSIAQRIRMLPQLSMNLPFWMRDDLLRTRPRKLLDRVLMKTRKLGRWLSSPLGAASETGNTIVEDLVDTRQMSQSRVEFMNANLRSLQAYRPQAYGDRVTLLRAHTRALLQMCPTGLGWHGLAKEVDIRAIPGTHKSIVHEPYVHQLTAELEDALSNAEATKP